MGDDRPIKRDHATLFVTFNGEPIGHMRIPRVRPSMAMSVPFTPLAAYERVRPLFRTFTEARTDDERRRFYATRDTLDFTIVAQDGRHIPVPWVHIYDLSVEMSGDEANAYGVEFPITADWDIVVNDDSYWTNEELTPS